MENLTMQKEKLLLLNMANAITTVTETINQNKKVLSNDYWINMQFSLYSDASDLAIKIMLQKLDVRATKKSIATVSKLLTEGNYHCPVEDVLGEKEEITWSGDYSMKIWIPEDTTLLQHYLDEVKRIINDYDLVA